MSEEKHERLDEIVSVGEDLTGAAASGVSAAALSIVPWAGPVAAQLLQTYTNHRVRRQLRFIGLVSEDMGRRVDRLEDALGDERRGELLEHGLDAASETRDAAQFSLLARVVSVGLDHGDDAGHLDRAHLLIDVVRQLLPDHVRLLRDLDRFNRDRPEPVADRTGWLRRRPRWRDARSGSGKMSASKTVYRSGILALWHSVRPWGDITYQPILGRLVGLGLVALDDFSPMLTPFGRELLSYLRGEPEPGT